MSSLNEKESSEKEKLGFAGKLGATFIHSKLTPVIAVVSILLGLIAVYLTPKEEEPQISVPMIDIRTPAMGYSAPEVEPKVTEPIERAMWGVDGVEYIYSTSQSHGSLITVRFKVGEPMEQSLLKIHHKLMVLKTELPAEAQNSVVKSYSIDDVPFLALTFTSNKMDEYQLRTAVSPLARELSSTPDLLRIEVLGGSRKSIRVIVQPEKLSQYGVSMLAIPQALKMNNALLPVGKNWNTEKVYDVEVGHRLKNLADIQKLAIGQRGGRVVYLKDVAQITEGPEEYARGSILLEKNQKPQNAVSIVFAKRKGTYVVTLSKAILDRANTFLKEHEGADTKDLRMTVIRDYGATAKDKSNELIEHLLLATLFRVHQIGARSSYRALLGRAKCPDTQGSGRFRCLFSRLSLGYVLCSLDISFYFSL